jgi:uncharacterized membrane protein
MGSNGVRPKISSTKLARGLGWFSIGLGLLEVLAPRRTGKLLGIGDRRVLLPLAGLREIACGVGILTQSKPAGWVWARVGGDVMDLALLGASAGARDANPPRIKTAAVMIAGVTALDAFCGRELNRMGKPGDGAVHLEHSLAINKPPEELFRFWRDFENLPKFMEHLESVVVIAPNRSRWRAKGPAGTVVEWEAEVVNETPNELIAWKSVEGADVDHAGTVRFERAPGGRGTILRVKMQYRPMGGAFGAKAARLLGQSPEKQIRIDLLRFKQMMETGEIARTEGQPAGRPRSTSRKYDDLIRH